MPIVGSHQQAPVTIPINGTSPVDADEVRLNDNAIITNYNDHDSDSTIHVQSSSLASRPLAGTAGRLWLVTDNSQLYYDTGAAWVTLKLDASSLTSGTVPTARVVGAYDNITSVGTLDDLNVTGNAAAGSFTGPLTGNVTGDVTGNVTGNASTATTLSSARTFALSGDVTGAVSSNLSSGATIATSYTATVPTSKGGTGLTATPTNGQIPIGNGTGYTLAQLTSGTNIAITNAAGSVTINAVGPASGVSGTGTNNVVPRWTGGGIASQLQDSAITDTGTAITLGRASLTLGSVAYTVPTVQGAAGTALVNDGSGTLTWSSVAASDVAITPAGTDPYVIGASDAGKRLIITAAGRGGFVLDSTAAIPVGTTVQVVNRTSETTIQVGTTYSVGPDTPNCNAQVRAIALQADGKVLIGGNFTTVNGVTRNYMARLNADLTLDTGYNPNCSSDVWAIAMQSDGKAVIGGQFTTVGGTTRNYVARLNTDGTLDATFNAVTFSAASRVSAVAVQSDGNVLIGGTFTSVNGSGRNYIARLTSAAALDGGYNPNCNLDVNAIALQSDGKAVVGGAFATVGGTVRQRAARINTNGSLDTTFNADISSGTSVNAVAVQTNGSILLGGTFTTVGGATRNNIARVDSTGALDTGFNPNANGAVLALGVQANGSVALAGSFTSIGGMSRFYVGKVTSAGALDTTFNTNANNSVNAMVVQPYGSLLVGGTFTTIGGVTRNRFGIMYSRTGANLNSLTVSDSLQTAFGNAGVLPQYGAVELVKTGATEWTVADVNFDPGSVQTFDSSGTWIKPGVGSMALIEAWGGGGGGGNDATVGNIAGGGGGGYMFRAMRLADIPSTVTVTVGAGGTGAGAAVAASGTAGGTSSFGTLVTAYGGGGGSNTNVAIVGGGGSGIAAGVNANVAGVLPGSMQALSGNPMWVASIDRLFSGGFGATTTNPSAGFTSLMNSIYGGGGGGSGVATNGTSVYGGNGGATGANGTTPGGGGGRGNGTSSGTGGGTGGGGRVRITVW